MGGGCWGGHTLLARERDSLWDLGDGGVVACASLRVMSVLTGGREVLGSCTIYRAYDYVNDAELARPVCSVVSVLTAVWSW
jgi:hypothetical protein